ncbi:hypothetical protein PIB30_040672 [Stylosanthes scabra]|uniref:TIR domain-containing protein n=1 Tax=Stylosanthes scabra TaxID=79078 RepID=A0ABU6QE19_9FABA|nr:hypothetical protein [Stylosanthes scabra]
MGDQVDSTLMEAIKRSRMFIVVMSENYVSSSWCLMELEEMLKYSNNGTKRPIFPIFYHVEPAEVRHQISEKSKKAMEDHERRVGIDKVKEWKLALSTLCGLSGQHIVVNKEYETQVMGEIAEKVLAKYREIKQLLNRFDSQVEAVESLLNLESRDTLGMVGIYEEDAKIDITTFAFELYYKIKYEFKAASFLLDVSRKLREDANGLENIQKELLSDMGVDVSTMMGSTSSGFSEIIKQMLRHKRVLLVLDGVDSQQHLELLAGRGAWFGGGSRIIITTEVKDLLYEIHGVEIRTHCIREDEFHGNRGSSTMMEENVVGLEKDFRKVMNQLKDKDSPGNVVSVVGMGGSGKTTLAHKVYNSSEARQLFPCRAWATISQKPILTQVFRNLLKCLKVPKSEYENSSDEEELKEKVRNCLNRKKYLVVLDDVWATNNPWRALRGCFPKNNGGMILVTTRNHRVANALESKIPLLTVTPMDEEESWQLFRNEVFYSTMCPPELEGIGRSIAENCNGLPLLIKTTAGIVAKRERLVEEWEEIKKLLPYWSIAEDNDGKEMMKRLKLSYDDLSEKMKPCFLYLGAFPEDSVIRVRELICMWMAEEFIKPTIQTGRSAIEPEDIGEQYLKELVDRNLVQVVKRRSDGKGIKSVKIHDIIRELCISESNSNKACLVTPPDQSSTFSLLVHGHVFGKTPLIPDNCQVMNVLYLKRISWSSIIFPEKLKSIRFLQKKDRISDFLEIRDMQSLFSLILQNLQSLCVRSTSREYQISIGEGLKQLRHFRVHSGSYLLEDAEGVIDKMQNLQTLFYVYADSEMGILLGNGYFANLRTLGLMISEDEVQSLEENLRGLDKLSKLCKLKLNFDCSTRVSSLDKIAFPSNLSKITLSQFSYLQDQDMNALGRIPNLKILKFYLVSCTENILRCGSAGSFPQLQVFIQKSVEVTSVTLENRAMSNLQRAVFHLCRGLKYNCLPEQMHCLGRNLRFIPHEDDDDDLQLRDDDLQSRDDDDGIVYMYDSDPDDDPDDDDDDVYLAVTCILKNIY